MPWLLASAALLFLLFASVLLLVLLPGTRVLGPGLAFEVKVWCRGRALTKASPLPAIVSLLCFALLWERLRLLLLGRRLLEKRSGELWALLLWRNADPKPSAWPVCVVFVGPDVAEGNRHAKP
jgi:hypothetical protein